MLQTSQKGGFLFGETKVGDLFMDQNLGRGVTESVVAQTARQAESTRPMPSFEELMRRRKTLLELVRKEEGGGVVDGPNHRLFELLMPFHQNAILNEGTKFAVDAAGNVAEVR